MKNLKLLVLAGFLYLGIVITTTNLEGEPVWIALGFIGLSLISGGVMGWFAARQDVDVVVTEYRRRELDKPFAPDNAE